MFVSISEKRFNIRLVYVHVQKEWATMSATAHQPIQECTIGNRRSRIGTEMCATGTGTAPRGLQMSDSPTGLEDEEEAFLYLVEYDDDAERKRVEYLFDSIEGHAERPNGVIRLVSDVDQRSLHEELLTKVPEDQVTAYRLEPVETDVTPETVVVERTVSADRGPVESFVEYVLSKRKAVLQSASNNEYEIYSKKGRAEVSYRLAEADGGTHVTVRIEGYPPAPSFLAEFFRSELTDYAESQT
jgi:hypothetical protein